MKSLIFMTMDKIFPKDVVIYIYTIIHKELIHEMNKEYHDCIITSTHDIGLFSRIKLGKRFRHGLNYRNLNNGLWCKVGFGNKMGIFNLPSKYIYSSGMSDPHGYKMIPYFN